MRFADRPALLVAAERPTASGGDTGFTLLEMLVVLAIIGLTLGATTWALKPIRDRSIVRGAMTSFKTLSDLARRDAIETGRGVSLSINADSRTISAEGIERSEHLPAEIELTWTSGTDWSEGGAPPNHPSILFMPDGTSSGGKLTARVGSVAESVRISWVSGAAVDEP